MTDVLVRPAVYGHLVGDAIGVPYEFTGPQADRVVEVRGGGAHGQPPGTWSDDGSLMLALLDSLRTVGFDPEDQGRRALAWWDRGEYTPDGRAFDIGGATSAALSRIRAGVPAAEAGGTAERDQGNGSLMRILPIALAGTDGLDDAELVHRAHLASRVTHGHPNCLVACALYVLTARALLEHRDGDPEVALALSIDRLMAVYARQPDLASVLRELLAYRARLRKPGGGWVLDSFWSAWEAVATSASYRQSVERCVRYGHDTDTSAAIAGGLAGIRWGMDEAAGGIPAEWLAALRGRDLVDRILGS